MVAIDSSKKTEAPYEYTQVIEATTGWGSLDLGEVWRYRDLVLLLFWRNLKGSYQQMALGTLWTILSPLLAITINTIIFSVVAGLPSDELPYPLFNLAAMLPWTIFISVVNSSSRSLVDYHHLMKKIYFPRLVLPLVGILDMLYNIAVQMLLLLVMMAFWGFFPNPLRLLYVLPFTFLVAIIVGLAIGLLFAPMIVHFRDFSQILSYTTRALMYASPIVYSISIVPDWLLPLYKLNPLTGVIQSFRWAMLGQGYPPDLYTVGSTLVMGGLLYVALHRYKRAERTIVDIA